MKIKASRAHVCGLDEAKSNFGLTRCVRARASVSRNQRVREKGGHPLFLASLRLIAALTAAKLRNEKKCGCVCVCVCNTRPLCTFLMYSFFVLPYFRIAHHEHTCIHTRERLLSSYRVHHLRYAILFVEYRGGVRAIPRVH